MGNIARTDPPQYDVPAAAPVRSVIGVHLDSGAGRGSAVAVTCPGEGKPPVVSASVECEPSPQLVRDLTEFRIEPTRIAHQTRLVPELSRLAVQLAQRALAQIETNGVLCMGMHGFGVWDGDDGRRAYHSLCDTALIAEATGLNVVDDFPARDLAQGGCGGPLEAHGLSWVLGKGQAATKSDDTRVLINLGETFHLIVLSPNNAEAQNSTLLAHDIGPGMNLLGEITRRLTGGKQASDQGGRLAVQGKRISELFELWLGSSTYREPKWRPGGVSATPLVYEALNHAVENEWSVRDMLCTATHLLAESISRHIKNRLPGSTKVDGIILAGDGCRNGMLLRELQRRLEGLPLVLIDEFGISGPDLDAVAVAGLTLLHIHQIPSPPTAGGGVARVLGRLTPGNPNNWRQLLKQMANRVPEKMTLRSAL